jgi:N-acetylmuramoyl-L-alanine amidase
VVALVVLVGGGATWALLSTGHATAPRLAGVSSEPLPSASIGSQDGSSSAVATASLEGTASAADIEVPLLTGKPIGVAEALVTAAGLVVRTTVADPPEAGVQPDTVISQWPQASALVPAGTQVAITYQPQTATSTVQYVVVIDPGHQQKPDLGMEPLGPGSNEMKEKVAGGVTGIVSGPEYALTLSVSLQLRDLLVAKGVTVVMVRTTNNVDIPNSQRAVIGNQAKADLVVRVHFNGSTDPQAHGITTLFPAGNSWVTPITAASKVAAGRMQAAVVAATGAASLGISGTGDMAGFNYSTRPTVMVECGFLSNPTEDKNIATAAYRQKIAAGIAAGVMDYLQGR